jgi:hypothetical protein
MTDSPYLLLIETSAIADTDPNTWQAIAKLGKCLLPEVVAIEIKNIANGKADGNESVARQFQNLLPSLNWQVTSLTAKHPNLLIKSTQNLSRKAKLMNSIAQGAVGLANAHPRQCVVLISDEISLRDRIANLDSHNLCAIPSAIARQWSRTDRFPPLVEKFIKKLHVQADQTILQTEKPYDDDLVLVKPKSSPSSHATPAIQSSNPKSSTRIRVNYPQIIVNLFKFGLATTFLATISLLVWRSIQPQQFERFWEKTGLPHIPQIAPNDKPLQSQPNKK